MMFVSADSTYGQVTAKLARREIVADFIAPRVRRSRPSPTGLARSARVD
jgi:hypothetical protein